MNRWQRSGITCAAVGLVLGVLSYITGMASQASVNGVTARSQATILPPITIILVVVGAALYLIGLLARDRQK